MKLTNHTQIRAQLLRTGLDKQRLAAALVARATFDIVDGEARLSEEQAWQVSPGPLETPHGILDGELPLRREGVDLFMFGTIWAPQGKPVPALDVRLELGSFTRSARVSGDRVWQARGTELVPSAPRPFANLPLSLEYAYGGKLEWDGLVLEHGDNPKGRGYYASPEEAADKLLPNIEESDQLVKGWQDRPTTAGFCFCAMTTQLRIAGALTLNEQGMPMRIERRWLNAAFPRMIAPAVEPGDAVRITGMSPDGPLHWQIPRSAPRIRLRFGSEQIDQPLRIDQVGFEVDARRLFVSYRFPFRYVIHREQLRSCELLA